MVRVEPYLRMVEALERHRRLLDTIDVLIKECKKLAEERAKIRAENAILTKENAELRKKIAIMEGILAENKARVAILTKENAELRKKIASMKENDEGLITVKEAAIGLLSGLAFGMIVKITINFVLKK